MQSGRAGGFQTEPGGVISSVGPVLQDQVSGTVVSEPQFADEVGTEASHIIERHVLGPHVESRPASVDAAPVALHAVEDRKPVEDEVPVVEAAVEPGDSLVVVAVVAQRSEEIVARGGSLDWAASRRDRRSHGYWETQRGRNHPHVARLWEHRSACPPAAHSRPSVVHEEEGPVKAVVKPGDGERTAECRSELVVAQWRLAPGVPVVEEVGGVGRVVPKEVLGRTATFVGSGLRGRVDLGGGAPELGRGRIGLQPEFPDAVDQTAVRFLAGSADVERWRVQAAGHRPPGGYKGTGRGGHRPGGEYGKPIEAASFERKVRHLSGSDDLAHRAGFRGHQRRRGLSLHAFADIAHLECEIDASGLIDERLNVRSHGPLETSGFGRDLVIARLELGQGKIAVTV